jgi:hypothetical protein
VTRQSLPIEEESSHAGYREHVTPPAPGTVPDPISEWIKGGRWEPAETAQAEMVNEFKKENDLKQ